MFPCRGLFFRPALMIENTSGEGGKRSAGCTDPQRGPGPGPDNAAGD